MAWNKLGWEAVAFSEIAPFPCAVLKHHYPNVPNWGDMTRFKEWEDATVDVVCGGTPCQSFSVAGLRKGMDDPRGKLSIVFLAIVERYRPRWVVWENVPGVLSADGGWSFGSFLGGLGEIGYGWSYRVLDAQYFGLAQRRKRVFVVGHLGDWRRAAAVLFERQSLSRNTPPSRKAGKEDYKGPGKCLTSRGGSGRCDPTMEDFIIHTLRAEGFDASEDGTGRGTPLVCGTMTASGAGTERPGGNCNELDFIIPDTARSHSRTGSHLTVRRMTPRECERAQGFPDDYTLIPYRGKPASDGPRYKSIGNSWAVPCARWIGERIDLVEEIIKSHN